MDVVGRVVVGETVVTEVRPTADVAEEKLALEEAAWLAAIPDGCVADGDALLEVMFSRDEVDGFCSTESDEEKVDVARDIVEGPKCETEVRFDAVDEGVN